jgi:hypothetical protein
MVGSVWSTWRATVPMVDQEPLSATKEIRMSAWPRSTNAKRRFAVSAAVHSAATLRTRARSCSLPPRNRTVIVCPFAQSRLFTAAARVLRCPAWGPTAMQ